MARWVMARVLSAWVMARARWTVVVMAGPMMAVMRSVTVRAGLTVRALAMGWPAGWAVRETQVLG
jgi:hypothetical protein